MHGSYWVWDDFLRIPGVRKGRQCIQPEVCRNFNFGAQVGAAGSRQGRGLSNGDTRVTRQIWCIHSAFSRDCAATSTLAPRWTGFTSTRS